jgi:peroxiredoxin
MKLFSFIGLIFFVFLAQSAAKNTAITKETSEKSSFSVILSLVKNSSGNPAFSEVSKANLSKVSFELAKIDGSEFVSADDFLGKKSIILFFDPDCAPCVAKLQQLNQNPPNFNKINIIIINLIDQKEIKNKILSWHLNPQFTILQAPKNPAGFLRKFGNFSAKLPFLALLNEKGAICLVKSEIFSAADFKNCL